MSFHARLAEDSDFGLLASSQQRWAKFQTAFAKFIRSLGLERKQFGIDLLTEFQMEHLRLEEIERLEAKNDHIDCSSPAFKHLDSNLRYYCELCNRQLPFAAAFTHLTHNEHLFRYTEFKYPMEYRRIETLESFDEQLAAIKSLHERIAQMLNDFFDVEPRLVKVRNKDEEIRRYVSKHQRRLYHFRPDIKAKLSESAKPPVVVKKQQTDDNELNEGDKSGKARLVSDTSMDDLTQINKRSRPATLDEEAAEPTEEVKMSESMLEAVSEEEEEDQLNMSQLSNFDVLFDEENDDFGRYIERLNDRLGSVAYNSSQLGEGFLLAFNEFFDNLDISNDLETLLKFKQVIDKKPSDE